MPVEPNDIAFGLDLFILTEVFLWIFIRFGFCMDFFNSVWASDPILTVI